MYLGFYSKMPKLFSFSMLSTTLEIKSLVVTVKSTGLQIQMSLMSTNPFSWGSYNLRNSFMLGFVRVFKARCARRETSTSCANFTTSRLSDYRNYIKICFIFTVYLWLIDKSLTQSEIKIVYQVFHIDSALNDYEVKWLCKFSKRKNLNKSANISSNIYMVFNM